MLFGKRPQINTVRKAAEHLIAIYNATSTLEVKKYLRAQGYVVFQYDVSRKMDKICHENKWSFQCNGTFRVYFIPQPLTVAQTNQQNVPAFSAN
jgi:arginine repressor